MSATESDCRDMAEAFPLVNVNRGIELAESGWITWEQLATVFRRALSEALSGRS